MTPGASPWIDVPDDWLDAEYCSDPEIARLQQFIDKKVKAHVIRKHLLAEGIGNPGELEILSITTESNNKECSIEATLHVIGMAWKVKDESNPGYPSGR